MAFKVAGSMAMKAAASKARPRLLEPVMDVEVVVPESVRRGDHGGSDVAARQGRGDVRAVGRRAWSPPTSRLGEMFDYATKLRSMTQGRGIYTMQFSRYDFMPEALAEEICKKVEG